MSDDVKTAQGDAATVAPRIRFMDMDLRQKLIHVGKILVCLCTLGFAFPNIFVD